MNRKQALHEIDEILDRNLFFSMDWTEDRQRMVREIDGVLERLLSRKKNFINSRLKRAKSCNGFRFKTLKIAQKIAQKFK